MKFRKKPVVIEAVQLRWDTWNEMCDFVGVGKLSEGRPEGCYIGDDGKPLDDDGKRKIFTNPDKIGLLIPTLEGVMIANQNDWIIKGVAGEFYPIKDDIFQKTYEKAEKENLS